MTKEKRTLKIWRTISIILLVLLSGSLFFFMSQSEIKSVWCEECQVCPETIEDKAILDVKIYEWGYNKNNPKELLFDYWITNYGDTEAKNVIVNCKLDGTYGTIFSAMDSYGNLASRSSEFGEFTPEKSYGVNMNSEYSAYCYVESCDNCEILYKRIPEIVKGYENN